MKNVEDFKRLLISYLTSPDYATVKQINIFKNGDAIKSYLIVSLPDGSSFKVTVEKDAN
jgi:hypothetical protein